MHFRLLLLLMAILLASRPARAQVPVITGSVMDTVNQNPLHYATVTLLHQADSVLETFTRTNQDGHFTLEPSAPGKYILMVSFPGFADYVDALNLSSGKNYDLGQLPMTSKTHLLEEFILTKQYAAIKVKGDTIEYMADSFAVRDNATVESLLKKLPGLQVDKNGQIMAQGEKVEKILVDGEEFFSDDPAVVSKSLQANAIDKVQVFDKKSDQAEFTGIDDGQKIKTINLQLKENRKKGYFGKVIAGAGAGKEQDYFEHQAMINAFKGKRKLAAFGIMSNTGKIGLGWRDRDNFSSNTNVSYSDGVMYTFSDGDDGDFDSWSGQYNGQGLPRAWTGGVHYSNKWNEDVHHLSGNYRYAKQIVETVGNTLTEYNLPDNSKYYTEEDRILSKSGQRHKVDALYEWKPDTSSSIKIVASSSVIDSRSVSDYNSSTFTDSGAILNTSDRRTISETQSQTVNASLDWRKRFKKKGRTISLNITERFRESQTDGFLNAVNSFNSGPDATVDQHKKNDQRSFSLASKLSYTEPLSTRTFLEINYSLKVDNSDASRLTYNKSNTPADVYDAIDPVFSNHYIYNVLTNAGGLNFRYTHKAINFSAGGAVSRANFDQQDKFADTSALYNFVNFFPSANFIYTISKRSKVNIRYSGSTRQPSINEIQPLRDNTDPLNIAIGNPYLTQEFSHNIYAQYNDYKMLTGRWLWTNGGANFVDNDISMAQQIDSQGRKTYQYINVDGNYNAWGYFGYGLKVKKLLRIDMNLRFNLNHSNNFINGVRNTSDNNSYSIGTGFSYDSQNEKLSVSLSPSVAYNDNNSAINTYATSFWSMQHEFEASYEFPLKIEAGTDLEWYIREQTSIFDQNNNVLQWNAYISKKLLKNDQLEIRANVHDILNQNIGFNRYAQNNYVYQDSYNTIRRYAMLSAIWNFTKTPSAPATGH